VTIQIASEVNKTSIPKPIQILAAYVCDESKHKLLLVHGNNLKPTFEKVVSRFIQAIVNQYTQ
jgi:hypothetical protein